MILREIAGEEICSFPLDVNFGEHGTGALKETILKDQWVEREKLVSRVIFWFPESSNTETLPWTLQPSDSLNFHFALTIGACICYSH